MRNNPLSSVLLKRTSLESAVEILTTNKFKLTHASGGDAYHDKKNYPFFYSTARSAQGSYMEDVTLVLDGRKLGYRYAGIPLDYWGDEKKGRPFHHKFEMEDRILSYKNYIPNALDYITEIHILFIELRGYTHDITKDLILLASRLKIPFYIYDKFEDYKLLNKTKAVKVSDLKFNARTPVMCSSIRYSRRGIDAGVWELMYLTDPNDLSARGKRWRDYCWYGAEELERMLECELFNNRRNPAMQKIVDYMRRKGLKTSLELVKYLFDKWNPRKPT